MDKVKRRLQILRFLVAEEINSVRPWAKQPALESYDNSKLPRARNYLDELEELLALLDEQLGPSLEIKDEKPRS